LDDDGPAAWNDDGLTRYDDAAACWYDGSIAAWRHVPVAAIVLGTTLKDEEESTRMYVHPF
jgi:hypothetical protein